MFLFIKKFLFFLVIILSLSANLAFSYYINPRTYAQTGELTPTPSDIDQVDQYDVVCTYQNCPSNKIFPCSENVPNRANYLCRCPKNKCRLSILPYQNDSEARGRTFVAATVGGILAAVAAGVGIVATGGVGLILGTLGILGSAIVGSAAGATVGAWTWGFFDDRISGVPTESLYICFDEGTKITLKLLESIDQNKYGFFAVKKGGVLYNNEKKTDDDPNLEYVLSTNFRNDFSSPVGNLVPDGSECKLTSDGNQAYWSFNVYKFLSDTQGSEQNILFKNSTFCENPILSSYDLRGLPVDGTFTFFGCLPNSINGLTSFIVRLLVGLSVFINLLIILINVSFVLSDPTNPDSIGESQKRIINSILILGSILFGIFFLRIFGIILFDQTIILGG